jgi:hypothetical protein
VLPSPLTSLPPAIPLPAWGSVIAMSAAACLFYTALGLPLARRLACRGPAALALAPLGLAPALGWAVFNAAAFPLLSIIGFGPVSAGLLCAAALAAALVALRRAGPRPVAGLPGWALPLAWLTALLPALALLPKFAGGGIRLAPPMFDHAKVAIVQAVLRAGLPVQNPFFAPHGDATLSYYYLWHFSSALLAAPLGCGGWTAEAGMTWFTGFAAIVLMMTLARAFGGRGLACALVPLLSLSATARPLLTAVAGAAAGNRLIPGSAELGGWLNQSAWVPQHLQSACCVVLALLLVPAAAGGILPAILLGIVVAAGYGSSAWVGGVAFAVAAPACGLVVLARLPASARAGWVLRCGLAALLAAAVAAPFLISQLGEAAGRQGGAPVAFAPYGALGSLVAARWRPVLDLPAFWLLLPFEFPAIFPLGALALWGLCRGSGRALAAPLAAGVLGFLAVAWLLRSTIDNNDLGWRAVLPPVLILTAGAASWIEAAARRRRAGALAAAGILFAAGLPGGAGLLSGYAFGELPGQPAGLAGARPLWQAVRAIAGPGDRVVNNPEYLGTVTPWPVNISWALLSDRPSCYSNWETVLAYGGVSRAQLDGIEDLFRRVFDGAARPGDVDALADRFGCRVVILVPTDGAWARDPFAGGSRYALAQGGPDWRIYRRLP